ncbi:MAG: hypothetical protein ACI3XC_05360, partial [Phascolarctobacterium sp.]
MSKKWMLRVVLFIAMIAVMFGMTAIRPENAKDRLNAKINLKAGKTVTCTVDLGKQGAIKQLLNPNIYTIYMRLRTDTKEPLRCSGSGMEMFLSQGTKKGIWNELKPEEVLKSRGKWVPLNVELRMPREALQQHDVAQGTLSFHTGQKEYAQV